MKGVSALFHFTEMKPSFTYVSLTLTAYPGGKTFTKRQQKPELKTSL
jgi:hypothetical protein